MTGIRVYKEILSSLDFSISAMFVHKFTYYTLYIDKMFLHTDLAELLVSQAHKKCNGGKHAIPLKSTEALGAVLLLLDSGCVSLM